MSEWKEVEKTGDLVKDGKLYLFRKKNIRVIKFWGKDAGAWIKEKENPQWRCYRPQGKLIPTKNKKKNLALKEVPEEVREKIEKFKVRQWHLLQVLNRCGNPAMELAEINLPLVFMLGNSWVFNKKISSRRHLRKARSLLRKPQKEILAELGFPGRQCIVKIVQKIDPVIIDNIVTFLYFRGALQRLNKKVEKIFYHIPKISSSTLRFLTDMETHPYLTPKFMIETVKDERSKRVPKIYYKFCDVKRMVEMYYVNNRYKFQIHSINYLNDLHDDLIDKMNKLKFGINIVFPEEPIKGNENIIPIKTSVDLNKEGIEQHNCVYSYIHMIQRGGEYFYKVLAPERATLLIVKRNNNWYIAELLAKCNEPVKKETYEYVRKWIKGELESRYIYLKLFPD